MKKTHTLLTAVLLTSLALDGKTAPGPVPAPTELDIPYSPDNPPGPSFTDEVKQRQLADGQRVRAEIVAAFQAGRDSYTIPPGDYRFDSHHNATNGNAFALVGLNGNPEKPFRIIGYGANFWFNLTDHPIPHYHQMVKVFDCSHITFEGVTVDSDPRGCMDARVTAFDFEGNRIQVKPVVGTRLLTRMPGSDSRFIPYKSNGHHIASLYQIDEGWGPANVMYEKLERTDDGRYWLTMKNRKLLDTVRNEAWREAYGPEGTLEVGDMLGILYSASGAITLLNCKQITVRDCRFHAAKAGTVERYGYGDHKWINCYFMARPGSNNLLGGDGVMSSCMHGSTFDGRVVQRTTDDCFNSHGIYYQVDGVTDRSITFRKAPPPLLAPGHLAEARETKNDSYIGTLTVEHVEGKTVTFREPVGQAYATAGVMFPDFQNAGWVIRNSIFSDCYQAIRLCCGPGIFENNRVERVGCGLTLGNGKAVDPEGGLPHNVVIRDNVFIDTGVTPGLGSLMMKAKGVPIRNLTISNNVICNSGMESIRMTLVEGAELSGNIMIHPAKGQALLPKGNTPPLTPAAVGLSNAHKVTLKGNVLVQGAAPCEMVREVKSDGTVLEDNHEIGDAKGKLGERVRRLTKKHDLSASEIIEKVKVKLPH